MATNDNEILTGTQRDLSNGVANGLGALLYQPRTGRTRRLSRTSMSYQGVAIDVEYLPSSCIGPESYVEDVSVVEVAGVNITALLSEEQLGEIAGRIEQGWAMEEAL